LITKYIPYQYGVSPVNPSVNVHLRNSNEQYLILAKLYINNAPFIGHQNVNF